MKVQEIHQGSAECVIGQEKCKVEVTLTIDQGRIQSFNVHILPSTKDTQKISTAIEHHFAAKRVEELLRATPSTLRNILHVTKEKDALIKPLSEAVLLAVNTYVAKQSNAAFQEIIDHMGQYEEGYPRRTLGDYQFEHGDSECYGKH